MASKKIFWSIEGHKVDLAKCERTDSGHYRVYNKSGHYFECREDGTTPFMEIPYLYTSPVKVCAVEAEDTIGSFPQDHNDYDYALMSYFYENTDLSSPNLNFIALYVKVLDRFKLVSITQRGESPAVSLPVDETYKPESIKYKVSSDVNGVRVVAVGNIQNSEVSTLEGLFKTLCNTLDDSWGVNPQDLDECGVIWHIAMGAI